MRASHRSCHQGADYTAHIGTYGQARFGAGTASSRLKSLECDLMDTMGNEGTMTNEANRSDEALTRQASAFPAIALLPVVAVTILLVATWRYRTVKSSALWLRRGCDSCWYGRCRSWKTITACASVGNRRSSRVCRCWNSLVPWILAHVRREDLTNLRQRVPPVVNGLG